MVIQRSFTCFIFVVSQVVQRLLLQWFFNRFCIKILADAHIVWIVVQVAGNDDIGFGTDRQDGIGDLFQQIACELTERLGFFLSAPARYPVINKQMKRIFSGNHTF